MSAGLPASPSATASPQGGRDARPLASTAPSAGRRLRVFFSTFGCRVNQYETQVIRERMFADKPVESVPHWDSADLCLINTCTVTGEADSDGLKLLRRIARGNPSARIVVTGCLASRDPRAVLREAPGSLVVGNDGKELLPAMLGCRALPAGVTGLHGRARAFVKVQDGCNMSCTYCIVPKVRPELSSKPFPELEAEVRGLIARGRSEIVLCGVRLGRYHDLTASLRVDLVAMLGRLVGLPGDFRIRLSSLEITDMTDRLIELAASSGGRICPSFHLPVQSGSAEVLRRMGRWYSPSFFLKRMEALRKRMPGAAVFTDVMAGFPGETEGEFRESLDFIREAGFSGLHVFRYSSRPGTPAARERPVPQAVVRRRAEDLRELSRGLQKAFIARALGAERTLVMVEEGGGAVEAGGRASRPPSGDALAGGGAEGVAEDFLRVTLDRHPGPGLRRVRIVGLLGQKARGVLCRCPRLEA